MEHPFFRGGRAQHVAPEVVPKVEEVVPPKVVGGDDLRVPEVVPKRGAGQTYAGGEHVLYWSTTYNKWIPAKVIATRPGGVMVDVKQGAWLGEGEQALRLHKAHRQVPQGGAPTPLRVVRVG